MGLTLVQSVIDGGEEDLLRGELVVGLIAYELLESGGHVRDAQAAELLVIDLGEHQAPAPLRPRE